jgi:hypothetical protein
MAGLGWWPGAKAAAHVLLLACVASTTQQQHDLAPPVYGAYPTGGPVLGGTTVTIAGKEFGGINTIGLNRVRCSWGDPRPWQQSVFAAQQAEMDGWSPAESVLPVVPPIYVTTATRVDAQVAVTPALRATFGLPTGVDRVDLLECPSHEREAGDVNLWFSLRFYETVRCRRCRCGGHVAARRCCRACSSRCGRRRRRRGGCRLRRVARRCARPASSVRQLRSSDT